MRVYWNLLTITLVFIVLLSAIGITQGSHFCKLALAGIEQSCCTGNDCDTSNCCTEKDDQDKSKPVESNDCCTNIVKYFHQNSITVIQATFKIRPLPIFISLFTDPDQLNLENSFNTRLYHIGYPPRQTGRSFIVSVNSLLI